MPTRLPYGLSFIKPGAKSKVYTFTAGDVTPDVSMGTVFFNSTSNATITNFDGGELGKIIIVGCNSTGIMTLANSAGGINALSYVASASAAGVVTVTTGGNYSMVTGEAKAFVYVGANGWSELGAGLRVA